MKTFATKSAQETFDLGRMFAATLKPGDVVAIVGNLGSGKTRFVQGACAGLGVTGHVSSPTFTIINEYAAPSGAVAHIDLYRIGARSELTNTGVQEYFNERTVCFIEWAEVILDLLPPAYFLVRIVQSGGDDGREITIDHRETGIAA